MKVKLLSRISFSEKEVLPQYKRKNFSAVIFFDFYYKGEKIISFPQHFFIGPWGCSKFQKDSIDDWERYFHKKYLIENYLVNGEYFYLAKFIDSYGYSSTPQELRLYFWSRFFELNREAYDLIIKENEPHIDWEAAKKKGYVRTLSRYDFKIDFISPLIEQFCLFLEFELLEVIKEEAEKVKIKILSFLETTKGTIEKEGDADEKYDEQQEEIFSFVNQQNINFCSEVPARKRINLEDHFSDKFLGDFLKEIEKYGLIENPFQGEIETSKEEYKEYLISLYGPGKWEYTNLEIEKLDLSIEEMVIMHILLTRCAFFFDEELPSGGNPMFFSTQKLHAKGFYSSNEIPFFFFWYKIKEKVMRK